MYPGELQAIDLARRWIHVAVKEKHIKSSYNNHFFKIEIAV
jgi:hypothetical protein